MYTYISFIFILYIIFKKGNEEILINILRIKKYKKLETSVLKNTASSSI